MKEKILAALKTKFASFGFKDKTLEGYADYLAKSVTKEEEIENAVSGLEPLLKAMQPEIDNLRNDKSTIQKQFDDNKKLFDEYKIAHPEQKVDPPVDPSKGLTAADIQKIVADSIKPITDQFTKQSAEAKAQERRTQITAKAEEYKIPEAVAKYMNVPDDADLDTFMKQAKQDFSDNGFSEVTPPDAGDAKVEKENETIANMINEETQKEVEQNNK